MSWQPSQVATKRCLLGPSGHSFAVYCACAADAQKTTMANENISELPRIAFLPSLERDQAIYFCFVSFAANLGSVKYRRLARSTRSEERTHIAPSSPHPHARGCDSDT